MAPLIKSCLFTVCIHVIATFIHKTGILRVQRTVLSTPIVLGGEGIVQQGVVALLYITLQWALPDQFGVPLVVYLSRKAHVGLT